MKVSACVLSLVCLGVPSAAFVGRSPALVRTTTPLSDMASELGIPCAEECALPKFPNLPDTIHPGVLSGKAQVDLYKHAKENGALV